MIRVFLFLIGVLLLSGCAGTKGKKADWVENKLASLSIEQKIGQMMVMDYSPRFYNENNPQFQKLLNRVEKYHVGSIAFYRGNPYAVVRCINRFQEAADIPLLVMADMEWGISMRVNEGTTLMENMAIGATGSEEYSFEVGEITALEARAVGIHIGFVPVLDVNNNPDNIIINTRSFGEDPELVAKTKGDQNPHPRAGKRVTSPILRGRRPLKRGLRRRGGGWRDLTLTLSHIPQTEWERGPEGMP